MKNKNMIIAIAVLASALRAQGQQTTKTTEQVKLPLTLMEKEEVAWALQVLIQARAVSASTNQCVQFDSTLINDLKNLGLLNGADSSLYLVCVGSQNSSAAKKGNNENPDTGFSGSNSGTPKGKTKKTNGTNSDSNNH